MGFIAGGFGGLRNRLIEIVRNIGKREDALIQKIKIQKDENATLSDARSLGYSAGELETIIDLIGATPAAKPVNVPASGFMFSYADYVDLRMQHLNLLKKHLRIVDLSHRKYKSQRRRMK